MRRKQKFLSRAIIILVAAVFFIRGIFLLDPDFGWHLRMGEYILESSESVISEEAGAEKTITHPTTRRELSEGAMDGIFSKIRDSGIMEKTCEAEMVLDYYVDYFINLDGIQKEIRFPGCEPEFNAIDGLIDAAVN